MKAPRALTICFIAVLLPVSCSETSRPSSYECIGEPCPGLDTSVPTIGTAVSSALATYEHPGFKATDEVWADRCRKNPDYRTDVVKTCPLGLIAMILALKSNDRQSIKLLDDLGGAK